MKGDIWLDMLKKINAHCYDKRPVILLVDNCPSHKPPLGVTLWKHGHMEGYKMSNVLVVYFEPNCTSYVQPFDAGCIQTAKALYRKRHANVLGVGATLRFNTGREGHGEMQHPASDRVVYFGLAFNSLR